MGQPPSERGRRSSSAHGVERRDDPGDQAERDHQHERRQRRCPASARSRARSCARLSRSADDEQPRRAPCPERRRAAPAAATRRAPCARMRRPVKPSVFSTPISRVRSRTVSAMVLPTIIRMVTKAAPTTSVTMRRDVAELGDERLVEGLLGVGRGLGRRVGEHARRSPSTTRSLIVGDGGRAAPSSRSGPCRTRASRRNSRSGTA